VNSFVGYGDGQDLVVRDNRRLRLNCLPERELMETLPVDFLVIHREHGFISATHDSLCRSHEEPSRDPDVPVSNEVSKSLGRISNRSVGFVHDAQVELDARPPGSPGEYGSALVRHEYDLSALRFGPEEVGYFLDVRGCINAKLVDLADELVAVELARAFIAAHAQPPGFLSVGEKLPRPIPEALLDQSQARHSYEGRASLQRLSDPKGRQALSCAAGHDQTTAGIPTALEVRQGGLDGFPLVRSRLARPGNWSLLPSSSVNTSPTLLVYREPAVEANFNGVAHELSLANGLGAGVSDDRQRDIATVNEAEIREGR